jgi:predicted P-loop ATPase
MIEETDFETFLCLSKKRYVIFVNDKKTLRNLYKEEIKIVDEIHPDDLSYLSKFLDQNIYRIEKLVGNFIKDITLIIENDKILNIDIGIKKKNYTQFSNQNYLKNDLTEVKDLFKVSYQSQVIMHMLIINYDEDGNKTLPYDLDIDENNLYIVIKFISISNSLTSIFDKLLEKYQIQINQYMSGEYIQNFIGEDSGELFMMASRLKNGFNKNEVTLISKNTKNK